MDTEVQEILREISVTIGVAVKAGREYVVLHTEDAKWLLGRAKKVAELETRLENAEVGALHDYERQL